MVWSLLLTEPFGLEDCWSVVNSCTETPVPLPGTVKNSNAEMQWQAAGEHDSAMTY